MIIYQICDLVQSIFSKEFLFWSSLSCQNLEELCPRFQLILLKRNRHLVDKDQEIDKDKDKVRNIEKILVQENGFVLDVRFWILIGVKNVKNVVSRNLLFPPVKIIIQVLKIGSV